MTTVNLRKPCIVAPSDDNSVEKLYRGEFNNLECDYFSFSRNKLYEIFETGFFEHLNNKYGLLISDYEQEEIMDKEKLVTILNDDIKKFKDLKHLSFWNDFAKCITTAIEKGTGIFFFF
ncbi:MAG: hypothetical protein KGZ74_19820 [Chitinophagaceae bacterium]|nr:hypothetical protein [Chitinophagaceae bacterium]